MVKAKRFLIRTPAGEEPQPKAETPGAVLSKALTLALRATDPGVWEVVEYEDVIFRVHRLDSDQLDVQVERMK